MMRKAQLAIACACLALLGAGPAPTIPRVGQPAPDFRMKLLDGNTVSLGDLRGKVVIINLWATWCGPCREEMPALDAMQANGGKYGLQVYGVLVRDEVPVFRLRKVREALHYPLADRISGRYEPIGGAVPTNYIIDRKGVVRYARAGSLEQAEFAELIVPLLNERP